LKPDTLLAEGDGAATPLITAIETGCLASCAEMVGAMDAAVEITTRYLSDRERFGRPLADFQVLQHHLADMLIATEEARSLSHYAMSSAAATPGARSGHHGL